MSLTESCKADETDMLNTQMEDLRLAELSGDFITSLKTIYDLSGKSKKSSARLTKEMAQHNKPNWQNGKNTFSSLLNNRNGQ